MKTLRSYITMLLVATGVCFSSCEDFLDKQPDDMLSLDQVFASRVETLNYLANVYSFIPNETYPFNNLTPIGDEAEWVWPWDGANHINSGGWSPTYVPRDVYSQCYQGIRSASVFISRVDECEELSAELRAQYKAEARMLRAYYYFLLLRQYGPVPIVVDVIPVEPEFSATQIPRSSYDECVNYIVAEIDKAINVLPLEVVNEGDYGRPNKLACMALKSRVLLYAASPLWNGNQDYDNFKNLDGKPLVNTVYDANKWKKAADVARELIYLMPEGLYTKNDANGNVDPYLSYQYVFLERGNKEVIWARPENHYWEWDKHAAPRQASGWNGLSVTQQLVDSYHMVNGTRIDDPGSGYVEEGFSSADTKYTKAGTWNMYVNREPRFYASVTYNGSEWLYKGSNGQNVIKVELYATGRDGKNGSHDHTPSGYLIRKFVNPGADVYNGKYVPREQIIFRLAEIYLNYAEALNESDPGNPGAAALLNLVRERAGLPPIPSGLSQTELRERIRVERKIELAFESHRLLDTRRWKIAEQTDGGPMWGMNASKGTSFTDTEFYKRTIFEHRIFTRKHYLWPIPQYEMDRNKQMVQNLGW